MFRLPDLPNAGYATLNQKMLTDAICEFMRQCERDRLRLLTIVIEGPARWREVAGDVWRGLPIDTDIVDSIYAYFVIQASPIDKQEELLQNLQNEPKRKDIIRELIPYWERQREILRGMPRYRM